MTAQFVQALLGNDASGNSQASLSTSTGTGFGTGHYVVGSLYYSNSANNIAEISSITDGTNTYTLIDWQYWSHSVSATAIFFGAAASGATAVTVNFNLGSYPNTAKYPTIQIHEVSGLVGTIDGHSQSSASDISSTTQATPSISTVRDGDYIYVFAFDLLNSLGATTVASPFLIENDAANDAHDAYYVQSAHGSISATFTVTTAGGAGSGNDIGVGIIALSPPTLLSLGFQGAGSFTSVIRQRIQIPLGFQGAGSFTSVIRQRIQIPLGFQAAGSFNATARQKFLTGSAIFSAAASFNNQVIGISPVTLTLQAIGAFSPNIYSLLTSYGVGFFGSGSLYSIGIEWITSYGVGFLGVGTLNGGITLNIVTTVPFTGSGNLLSSEPELYVAALAIFAGAGALNFTTIDISPIQLTFRAAGTFTPNLVLELVTPLAFQGAGAFNPNMYTLLTSNGVSFTGIGLLSSAIVQWLTIGGVGFSGAGLFVYNQTAVPWQLAAVFAGAGGFIPTLIDQGVAFANFLGAGNFGITTQGISPLSESFIGNGSFTSTSIGITPLTMALQALGQFQSSPVLSIAPQIPAFTGYGQLGASQVLIAPISAQFTGSAGFNAVSVTQMVAAASFSAAGTVAVSIQQFLSAIGAFSGAGSINTTTTGMLAIYAPFQASGTITGTLSEIQAIAAAFSGVAGFSINVQPSYKRGKARAYWQINL